MAEGLTLILNGGGLRSLVATAVVMAGEKPRVQMLHVKDGRSNVAVRQRHFRRQAEYFKVPHTMELDLPHLQAEGRGSPAASGGDSARSEGSLPLARPQLLMVGLSKAIELGAQRVIWPGQFNAKYEAVARLTEQVELILQMVQLEHSDPPALETPLLELTDREVVEVGAQLDVPWALAWSCVHQADKPCRLCDGCRRRRAAFTAAGVNEAMVAAR